MFALLPVNVRLAIRSLNRNRLRTLLTMLGIIIGVGAVLTMVALGTGARASVQGEVASAGTNLVFVKAGNFTRGGESVGIVAGAGSATTLTPEDSEAIRTSISGIADVSPGISVRTFLTSGEARAFARVQGIGPGFARMYSWNFEPGKMLDENADQAVIGRDLATKVFGSTAAAVGKPITVRGTDVHDYRRNGWRRRRSPGRSVRPLAQAAGEPGLQASSRPITIAAEKAGETRASRTRSRACCANVTTAAVRVPRGYSGRHRSRKLPRATTR